MIVVDQLTKWWAASELEGGRTIDLFWTLRFKLVRNDGAAFSMGSGLHARHRHRPRSWCRSASSCSPRRLADERAVVGALGLVLGGALGNVIDRLFRAGDGFLGGRVVDFIDFQWYPVFNVADMGVVCGGFLVVWLARSSRVPPDLGLTRVRRDRRGGSCSPGGRAGRSSGHPDHGLCAAARRPSSSRAEAACAATGGPVAKGSERMAEGDRIRHRRDLLLEADDPSGAR